MERKGEKGATQNEKHEGGKKKKEEKGHFLMMKDEESGYQRKQSCKHSLLHAQFSKKKREKSTGTREHLYLLTCWQTSYTLYDQAYSI